MKILLRTLFDIGINKIQYRIRFEIKNLIYKILPSLFLRNLFLFNLKPADWDQDILKKIKLSSYFPVNKSSEKDKFNFKFLNENKSLSFPIVWNDKSKSRLWNFNLHYFEWSRDWLEDFIINDKIIDDFSFIGNLIDDWIDNNKIGKGNGWNSYTISLRIRNWVWLFNCFPSLRTKKRVDSFYHQFIWLSHNLEMSIGGNHLLENLISLLICSTQFKNKEAKKIFAKSQILLKKELEIQILNDGGHYERTASYHLLLLDRLLELVCVMNLAKIKIPKWLKINIKIMHNWAQKIHIGKNNFPRFNDSPLNGCEDINTILSFARMFGGGNKINYLGLRSLLLGHKKILKTKIDFNNNIAKDNLNDLPDTGWTIIRPDKYWEFIFKCGQPCPKDLPAHVHSDLLSFELFYDGKPVIAEVGTSMYGNNSQRDYERSSSAHNVLQIANNRGKRKRAKWIEPVEVWSNHRAGRKANILSRDNGFNNQTYWVKGSHDGYKKKGTSYERSIYLKLNDKQELMLNCIESIKCKKVIDWRQWWHFGPNINYEYVENSINLNHIYRNLSFNWKDTFFSTGFGQRIKRKSLYFTGVLYPGEHSLNFEINLSKSIFLSGN